MRISKDKITISVVGAGSRSTGYLNALEKYYAGQFEVVAVADPDKARRDYYKERFSIKDENIFLGYEQFNKMDRLSDVVIIGTLDDIHFEPAISALEKGSVCEQVTACASGKCKLGEDDQRNLFFDCLVDESADLFCVVCGVCKPDCRHGRSRANESVVIHMYKKYGRSSRPLYYNSSKLTSVNFSFEPPSLRHSVFM